MGMACDAEGSGAFRPRGPSLGRRLSQVQRFPEGLVVSTGGNLPSTTALSMGPTRLGETSSSSCDTATSNPFRMNTEETAMILTSLSKGQFAFGAANGNSHAAVSSGESDGEDFSHDEDDDEDDMMNGSHCQGQEDHHGDSSTSASNKLKRVQQINFDGPMGSKLDFMDDHGFSHRFRNESNRVKSLVTKHISIDELRAHFDRPIIDVAKDFGICITLMKKICRRNGIKRWPHRQIRSLSKSIASMEAAMLSAHGSERDKYRDQILNLKLKRESVIADPNKDNHHVQHQHQMSRPKTPTRDMGSSRPHHHHHVSPTLKYSPSTASSSSGTYAMGAMAQQMPTLGVKMESYQHRAAENTASVPVSNGSTHHHQNNHHAKGGRWTSEEHAAFLEGIRLYGKDWRSVAQVVMTRSAVQTRTHAQKYLLKFAGRFPFDTDGLLKDPAHQHDQHHRHQHHQHQLHEHESTGDVKRELEPQEYQDEHQQVNGSQTWPSESVKETIVPVQKPRHETMAMLLNSPYIEPAPEPCNGPVSPVFAGTSNSGSSTSSSPSESDVAKLAPLDEETTPDNNVAPA